MNRQKELRSLLRGSKSSQKLPSKLCGYNSQQQLICKLCRCVLKSVSFWKSHEKSIKHKQTLDHLTKLKAERESKRKSTASTITTNGHSAPSNDDTVGTPKESTSTETIDTANGSTKEEDTKREILVDGLPADFFDTAMKHKKPKIKTKDIPKENAVGKEASDRTVEQHVIVVTEDDEKNQNGAADKDHGDGMNGMESMDETDRTFAALEKEMKIERERREQEILEFMDEVHREMENDENREIDFKMGTVQQFREKLNAMKSASTEKESSKRTYSEMNGDHNNTEHRNNGVKKQKVSENENASDSDSDFDENDLYDFGNWRSQKL